MVLPNPEKLRISKISIEIRRKKLSPASVESFLFQLNTWKNSFRRNGISRSSWRYRGYRPLEWHPVFAERVRVC